QFWSSGCQFAHQFLASVGVTLPSAIAWAVLNPDFEWILGVGHCPHKGIYSASFCPLTFTTRPAASSKRNPLKTTTCRIINGSLKAEVRTESVVLWLFQRAQTQQFSSIQGFAFTIENGGFTVDGHDDTVAVHAVGSYSFLLHPEHRSSGV